LSFEISRFETDLIGLPVGRFVYEGKDAPIGEWKRDGAWFVSSRVPEGTNLKGFREVETLVTLECEATDKPVLGVPPAKSFDHDRCVLIAKMAFTNDRLHKDPMFPNSAADRIREAWVRNDLEGRADASFIAIRNGIVAGFILCLIGEKPIIDLIAVDPSCRNQGLGKLLVGKAQSHYNKPMIVGTQADNLASIALYEKMGFKEVKRETTFHWMNDCLETSFAD